MSRLRNHIRGPPGVVRRWLGSVQELEPAEGVVRRREDEVARSRVPQKRANVRLEYSAVAAADQKVTPYGEGQVGSLDLPHDVERRVPEADRPTVVEPQPQGAISGWESDLRLRVRVGRWAKPASHPPSGPRGVQ